MTYDFGQKPNKVELEASRCSMRFMNRSHPFPNTIAQYDSPIQVIRPWLAIPTAPVLTSINMQDATNPGGSFLTTKWSVVLAVGRTDADQSAFALERLCHTYWYPIYVFVRRRGSNRDFSHHEAEDLTQAFFAHLLEKESIKSIDRSKGRFRSFLLASLNNFLLNEWDKQQTIKRGGRQKIISLDELAAENLYREEPVEPSDPEKLYERRWAFTVINQVLARLKEEYAAADKAELFSRLEAGLTGELTAGQYADWSAQLKMSEGALKVALHRLRRRFGEILRSEVAETVADPSEVSGEIRVLLAAIST